MLIDDVTLFVSAGKGGDGIVAWDKTKLAQGPAGGNGGKGGDVFVCATGNLGELLRYRHKKDFLAMDGNNGGQQKRTGSGGEDLTLLVPVGTVVHDSMHERSFELVHIGETVLLARGGIGGRGNFEFRNSRNTSPEFFEQGKNGEKGTVRFELKMIADVGLIGFPNAGKSSLLNTLTAAKSKVANYPFTTLEPNLGAYYELIIADIPGLIEGASRGKGLGMQFLRHIERTKILFHLVSAESDDPVRDYKSIRNELGVYSPVLLDKEECVILSKTDDISASECEEKLSLLRTVCPNAFGISILDDVSMNRVKNILNHILEEKRGNKPQV